MRKGTLTNLSGAICCALVLMIFAQPAHAQDRSTRDYLAGATITGTVAGVGGRFAGRTVPFTVRVTSFTTPEEMEQLRAAYQSGGQDELLKAAHKMDRGRFQLNNNVGVPVRVALVTPTDNGTKVTVMYERNVRFYELRYGSTLQDYRFGYAEIFIDRNGRGEGTLIPAAKLRVLDNGTMEVENWGEFPARLIGVRVRR